MTVRKLINLYADVIDWHENPPMRNLCVCVCSDPGEWGRVGRPALLHTDGTAAVTGGRRMVIIRNIYVSSARQQVQQ